MNESLLIEKHLAEGLNDEEAALLEAAVGSDAVVARRLVAAARLDQRLVARLGSGRSERACLAGLKHGRTASTWITRWRRPLAMAAALALALGLVAGMGAWIRWVGSAPADSTVVTPSRAVRPLVPAPVPVVPDRVEDPPPLESETPAMASLRRFLSSYYLTDLQLEAARPLEEALEQLLQRARALNHLRNPVIERLRAEVAAAEPGDGSRAAAVVLPLRNLSLMEALQWMAAVHRSEVFLKEPGVITFRPWEPTDEQTLVTEVVRVRPDLLTRAVANEDKRGGAGNSGASGAGIDPRAGSAEAPAAPRLTPVELFQSWGIVFGGETSASYDEATAAMTLRHSASTVHAVRELMELASPRPLRMLTLSIKVFEIPDARSLKEELLTDEQFQVWLREMNETKGVNLLTAPQITVGSGQQGMIQIARDYPTEGEWRGLRLPVEPVLEGEVVKVVGAVELRLPIDRTPGGPLFASTTPAGELVTTATDFEVIAPGGQTAVFSMNDARHPPLAIAVTAVSVDP